MDVTRPLPLLGGLSPAQFMRRHWQKKPLWVRQAWPGVQPPLARQALLALVQEEDVESRLVRCEPARDGSGPRWSVRRGPMPRRALPPVSRPGWTLLVQGLDLHAAAAHAMLQAFRFVPAARLDDLMISWASDGGGVGPHTDAYDVFLLQVHGRRRWRVGPCPSPEWVPGAPLKRLARFEPTMEQVLEPGDMLYLPPHWGHDGVAVGGDCMTCSIGFRTPTAAELAREVLVRLADADEQPPAAARAHYRDPGQPATAQPARLPPALARFAQAAVARALRDPDRMARALGEWASEPKPHVWFEAGRAPAPGEGVAVPARSRLLYDDRHLFLNGESFVVSGRDALLLRQLADLGVLPARDVARLSGPARETVRAWCEDGWLVPAGATGDPAAAGTGARG